MSSALKKLKKFKEEVEMVLNESDAIFDELIKEGIFNSDLGDEFTKHRNKLIDIIRDMEARE